MLGVEHPTAPRRGRRRRVHEIGGQVPRTLIQLFLDTVDRHHKPVQFLNKVDGAWQGVSADTAHDTVERLMLGFEALGLARGDRIAIMSETRLEWALADLAALALGAVTVPIYQTLTGAQA